MKVAVVTGASRNIGLALLEDLSSQGYRVVGVSRDAQGLSERLRATRHPEAVEAMGYDLSDRSQCLDLAQAVLERHGRVDVLVHNAVHRATYPLAELPYEEWERTLAVVLSAAFSLMQAFVPGMTEAGWGRVVNIAGLSGQRGSKERSAVVAAKAGLMGLTKAVALEAGTSGVTVNAISPGPIDTDRGEKTSTGDAARVQSLYTDRNPTTPVGRRGRIADVVAACRYLVSDEASYVTGQTLSVNGGLLMP